MTDAHTGMGFRGQQVHQDECIGPFGKGHESESGMALRDLMRDHDMGAINTHREIGPTFIGH
eukprot:2230873-Pyramimonas_sp.AAC.1